MDSTSPSTEPRTGRGPRPPWWWATCVLAAVVALLIVTTASADPSPRHPTLPRTATGARVADRPPAAPTTTTTTPPVTPVVAPPPEDTTLHTPEDVPDPSIRRPIQITGRIRIPKIGLDTDLRDQITQESIDLGPSHWPGTAAPGSFGNAVVAGHRSSHSAPFHDLGALQAGDTIVLLDAGGRAFTYSVTETFIVNPDAMWIADQHPGHTLTLFTCHPIGGSSQRLVIRATLV